MKYPYFLALHWCREKSEGEGQGRGQDHYIYKSIFCEISVYFFSTAPVSEKAEGGGRGEDRTMPYWVRAVSMLEEYDEQSGMFVPVDRSENIMTFDFFLSSPRQM